MGKVNYLISEDIRQKTIDALRQYKSRLEAEAAALARFPAAQALTEERLDMADAVGELLLFYINL